MWNFLSTEKNNEDAGAHPANLKGELAALGIDVDTSFMDPPDDIPAYDEAHIASVLASAMKDPDDKDIELTNDDLEDTNLLSELSGLLDIEEGGKSLTEQLSELESKIRQGKTRCIQEKKAGRVESAKMIYLEVISREKEAASLREQMQKTSSGLQVLQPQYYLFSASQLEPSLKLEAKPSKSQHQPQPEPQQPEPSPGPSPREDVGPSQSISPTVPAAKHIPKTQKPTPKRDSDDGFGELEAMMDVRDGYKEVEPQPYYPPPQVAPQTPAQRRPQRNPKRSSDDDFGHLDQLMSGDDNKRQDVEPMDMEDPRHEPDSKTEQPQPGPVLMDLLGITNVNKMDTKPTSESTLKQPPEPTPIHTDVKQPIAPRENPQVLIREIQKRITQCKLVAKQYRDCGERTKGLDALRVMKGLEKIMTEVDSGMADKEYTLDTIPPVPVFTKPELEHKQATVPRQTATANTAQTPKKTTADTTLAPKSTTTTVTTTSPAALSSQELTKRTHTLEMLEAALHKQIDSYAERAKADKEGNRPLAMSFMKLKKVWTQDLEKISDQKGHPFIPPPAYHFEDIETKRQVINSDLSPHHLEIQIQELKHLKPPDGYDTLSLYLIAEFAYPNEETKQTFKTDPLPVNGPAFNAKLDVTKLLKIERKKSLEMFARNKKIVLNLWHARGWLFRDVAVGKVEVKLNPLLEQSTFIYDADVVTFSPAPSHLLQILDGRKPTGGMITIQVRLRTPISKPEVEVTKDRILFIDKHYTFEDALAMQQTEQQEQRQQQEQQQQRQRQQKQESERKQAANPQQPKQPAQQPKQPAPQPTETPKPTEPRIDPDSLDWIVSNYVLECTMKEVQEEIDKAKTVPGADVLELEIKLQLLNLHIARLFELISTGQLTQEIYVQMLKNKIEEERVLAETLTSEGKKKKAAEAVKRMKWMEEELSGC